MIESITYSNKLSHLIVCLITRLTTAAVAAAASAAANITVIVMQTAISTTSHV